jgi:hypothetical protein
MKPLTREHFDAWMAAYGAASANNDPRASAELFSEDARYYESPFDEPLVGREAIYRYWAAGAQHLADKCSTYELLALRNNLGIARWQARFVVSATGVTMALDCIFVAEFDDHGRCRCFREWWHRAELSDSR